MQHSKKTPTQRYGKLWNTISFDLTSAKRKRSHDESQPIIGSINIGNRSFDITWTEATRIIDQLHDGQQSYNTANRLGLLEPNSGTYR